MTLVGPTLRLLSVPDGDGGEQVVYRLHDLGGGGGSEGQLAADGNVGRPLWTIIKPLLPSFEVAHSNGQGRPRQKRC